MALRAVQVCLQNNTAPVSGWAIYFVVGETDNRVELLHPWTLTHFTIPILDFQKGEGATYWPLDLRTAPPDEIFDIDKVTRRMQELLEDFALRKTQHSAQLVRRVIAEIKGVPLDTIPQYKETRVPVKKEGGNGIGVRRPGVIDAIKEFLEHGGTVDEMLKDLQAKFPERNADGMRNTIKCQLARLPKNTGRSITKSGTGVYKWGK